VNVLRSPFGELVEAMMEVSSAMTAFGARQFAAAFGEATSRLAVGNALRLLQQSAGIAGAVLPGDAGLEWRELANKLEAFEGFQRAGRVGALLERPGLGTYGSLWAAEGLGFAHARNGWAAGPRGRSAIPLIPLQTGAALAFAGRLLDHQEGLERWLALWEEQARPGFRDLAVEALGLVARNLYPQRLDRLAADLRALDPGLDEPFWHGVGRGLYFAPTHAMPWSGAFARALEKAWREPPHEPGRLNAVAGLAWAFTLVNLRHPEILDDGLERSGAWIGSAEAFANGVASAVLIWYGAVGQEGHLDAFLAYRPVSGHREARWHELVLSPCREALRRTGPHLQEDATLAGLFRFRTGS
jgi:hypothetical protein